MVSGTDKSKLKTLGDIKDITKSKEKNNEDAVKYFTKILGYIPFDKTFKLEYPTSNWAAVEGYILKKIHKKEPNFGSKNLLSKKGLEVYKKS